MTNKTAVHRPSGPLDQLTDQLLGCGAVVSQIISHMVISQTSGASAPYAAPIPEVAHSLISQVLADLADRFTDKDINTAARLVSEATALIADNVFLVPRDRD